MNDINLINLDTIYNYDDVDIVVVRDLYFDYLKILKTLIFSIVVSYIAFLIIYNYKFKRKYIKYRNLKKKINSEYEKRDKLIFKVLNDDIKLI